MSEIAAKKACHFLSPRLTGIAWGWGKLFHRLVLDIYAPIVNGHETLPCHHPAAVAKLITADANVPAGGWAQDICARRTVLPFACRCQGYTPQCVADGVQKQDCKRHEWVCVAERYRLGGRYQRATVRAANQLSRCVRWATTSFPFHWLLIIAAVSLMVGWLITAKTHTRAFPVTVALWRGGWLVCLLR